MKHILRTFVSCQHGIFIDSHFFARIIKAISLITVPTNSYFTFLIKVIVLQISWFLTVFNESILLFGKENHAPPKSC